MDAGRGGTGSFQSTGSLASLQFSSSESLGFSSSFVIHNGVLILVKDDVHAVVMTLPIDNVDAPGSVLCPHDVDAVVVYKYKASHEDGGCGHAIVALSALVQKGLEHRHQ